MLVVMNARASEAEARAVCEKIRRMGLTPHPMPGEGRTAIGITGNPGPLDPLAFESMPGVLQAIPVTKPYKLVGREIKPDDSVVRVGPEKARLGGGAFSVIAGPCAIESREQALAAARAVKAAGAVLFRGGAYKPRTSPYAFQGLGEEGLEILKEVRAETGLGIVTEAVDPPSMEKVAAVADMVQIGARNMQNYSLLRLAGGCGRPVLLKRGMSATLEELLMAAEYVLSEGNYDVVLCERGVRTFADHTRSTLDLSLVPAAKRTTHLPVVVDPSHAAGRRDMVPALCRAALAVGAHGLMVEAHHSPEKALSDGPQSLDLPGFRKLMKSLEKIGSAVRTPVGGRPAARRTRSRH